MVKNFKLVILGPENSGIFTRSVARSGKPRRFFHSDRVGSVVGNWKNWCFGPLYSPAPVEQPFTLQFGIAK